MTSNRLPLATAILLAAVGGRCLAADPPRPAGAPPVAAPAAGEQTFRAKQIIGSKIEIRNNTAVGTVEDIVFDDAGNLEYLIVSKENGKLITVPWDAAKWNVEKRLGTVNIAPEALNGLPTYTTTTYPQFYAPTYRTEVYKTYGLTPRALRRMERRIP